MSSASAIRHQIESALAHKAPSALTPAPKIIRPVTATGVTPLDDLLRGGLPEGAISELVGPECSGRTSTALSFLAGITQAGKVCAWIDVSNAFDPISAAAVGIDLARLLWVRCGVSQKNVPRTLNTFSSSTRKPWTRIEEALRVADQLLQSGGFSAVVLDMGGIEPEFVSRISLATWFRYRAAAERTRSSVLLLTQYACAKSSAELLLQFQPGGVLCDEATVFTGMELHAEVVRRRFAEAQSNVVPMRKPPQNVNAANWQSRIPWAGCR